MIGFALYNSKMIPKLVKVEKEMLKNCYFTFETRLFHGPPL